MLRSASARFLGAIAIASFFAACARTDATPAPGTVASAAGGEVAATPAGGGMASGLTDSVSTAADRGRIRGAATAPVWVVEVSDFQCPYCKQWHDESFAAIDREFVQTGKVRLAYLNFPLGMHANARAASEAAMCASAQGKFWPMHESLFVTQQQWQGLPDPLPRFDSLAVAGGVEPTAWRDCMRTHATAKLIDADLDRSRSAGVRSTPTFFIGDRMLLGAYPVDSFRVAIDAALAKARGTR